MAEKTAPKPVKKAPISGKVKRYGSYDKLQG